MRPGLQDIIRKPCTSAVNLILQNKGKLAMGNEIYKPNSVS
jgi:hypothetical protein